MGAAPTMSVESKGPPADANPPDILRLAIARRREEVGTDAGSEPPRNPALLIPDVVRSGRRNG